MAFRLYRAGTAAEDRAIVSQVGRDIGGSSREYIEPLVVRHRHHQLSPEGESAWHRLGEPHGPGEKLCEGSHVGQGVGWTDLLRGHDLDIGDLGDDTIVEGCERQPDDLGYGWREAGQWDSGSELRQAKDE